MNSLLEGAISQVLERLHRAADKVDASIAEGFGDEGGFEAHAAEFIEQERANLRGIYAAYVDNFLCVSPEFGRFLYACVRAKQPTCIVEFGSSMGVSAIYMASALRDNGQGRMIGSEFEPSKVERAREHVQAAGLTELVEIRQGDALETLRSLAAPIDMLHLDGALSLYLPVLKLLEPRLEPGALILGENALSEEYLAYVRDPANRYVSQPLPFEAGRGNELTVFTG